jgi:excisionase family DNA binding protein
MVAETDTPAEHKWHVALERGASPEGRTSDQKGTAVERQTVSIMKACEMVGVSRRTIYNWIAAGKVEYVRTAGGSIRIFVDTLWRQPDGAAVAAATHV